MYWTMIWAGPAIDFFVPRLSLFCVVGRHMLFNDCKSFVFVAGLGSIQFLIIRHVLAFGECQG